MTRPYPYVFPKRSHRRGCTGQLSRRRAVVTVDRTGRIGNGGIVAHDYCCNQAYEGCPARVLVTELAVREMAVSVEVRP